MMNSSSRGRIVCSGCRSRKQKCDGERPVCGRCRSHNRDCTWPRPQKRGPAKGYAGALEHRLEEMEHAFLQILSVVDDNLIDAAFNNGEERRIPSRTQASSIDSSQAGSAKLLAQWEQYPLKTADDIKRWANVRWEEPTKPPEELCADTVELGNRDTPEQRESVYDSSSRYDPAVPSPLNSLSPDDGNLELSQEFKETFIW